MFISTAPLAGSFLTGQSLPRIFILWKDGREGHFKSDKMFSGFMAGKGWRLRDEKGLRDRSGWQGLHHVGPSGSH